MPISLTQTEKQILKQVNLPPRPQALLDFSEEAKKPEPNITKIAEILHADVAISAAILQVVNSAAFRRNREIESIDQAILMLGLKRVIPLVKAVALKSSIKPSPLIASFWEEQTQIAETCSLLCKRLNKETLSNYAYMLGLFHFSGIPILLQHFEDFGDIFVKANEFGWDQACQIEFSLYQTSHATLGALLAQQWGLPKAMMYAIYYQHDLDGLYSSGELEPVGLDLLSILKLARHARHVGELDHEWQSASDQVLDYLDIGESEVDDLLVF
ncbi:Predicted signal transduction protein [Pseudoalteromonas luteoviolacea B = ATCC 29581]|nr:Predicted signal transduction protein [Pseudoalteromonas luteoviolacea B = ATCC 29581]